MKNCVACHTGSVQERLVPEYEAGRLLGAPFPVILRDSVKEQFCLDCGEKVQTIIPDLNSLLHTVAATRAVIPQKLNGRELKFLRKSIGMKSKDVAASLEMSAENLSRVEKDMKLLGPQSEKLFRVLVVMRLFEDKHIDHDVLSRLAKAVNLKITPFWSPNAAFVVELRHKPSDDEIPSSVDNKGLWIEQVAA